MSYDDEHYGNSKAAYDGELIDLADAIARYERDRKIREKYEEAARNTDSDQLDWQDVKKKLE